VRPAAACPALGCLAALPTCGCPTAQHRAGSGVPELGWVSRHTASLRPCWVQAGGGGLQPAPLRPQAPSAVPTTQILGSLATSPPQRDSTE